jgi:hypothetical protein
MPADVRPDSRALQCALVHPEPGTPTVRRCAAMPAELRLLPVAGLDDRQVRQLELVYAQAFPAHLRVPVAELAKPGPRDQLVVALLGDEVAGFAALRLLASANWAFLRYFGVAADRRRQRLGQRFWQLLTPSIAVAGWPARIAFEVEDPAEAPDDPAEQAARRGRIAFWENCGAVRLPVPRYVMPALTSLGAAEPMILMAVIPDQLADQRAPGLAELVQAIYGEHYRLAADHPLTVAALKSITTRLPK